MSHEGGPEQTQRTVAELLAKYGAESGERAPRRRRRRADDVSDTGAQAIINRVMSESGEMPVIRDDMPPPERTSHRRGADTGFQRPVEPPRRRSQPSQPLPRPAQALPPQPSQQLPRPPVPSGPPPGTPVGPPSVGRLPAIARPSEPTTPVRGAPRPSPRPQPSQRMPVPPPVGNRERSGIQPSLRARLDETTESAPPPPPPMPAPPVEPATEELPRVPGRVPVDGSLSGRRPTDSRTRISPVYPAPRDPYGEPEEDYRNPYPDADPDDRYESDRYGNHLDEEDLDRDLDPDLDDDLDELEDDDLDADRERSAAREWLIMAGQLALGVIGGAGVWLGFNWLWGFLPQAALVVALAVIVGLVVTVSPAALLLLNR
ncbi:MAG: hypothetical protein LC635_01155 [Pseudonocardiaceae bacterium]|nr:hypothetical protein [Pseudonocardiaceae bacterium]